MQHGDLDNELARAGGNCVGLSCLSRHACADGAKVAAAVEVDVLARSESAVIMQHRVTGLSEADADQLAAELGDLPLAVTQAAEFMAETGRCPRRTPR